MITLIIFLVLGLILTIICIFPIFWGKDSDYETFIGKSIFSLFVLFLVEMGFGLIGLITATAFPVSQELKLEKTIYLENLSDGNSMSGSFFLGCGTIDNVWNYSFYYMEPNGNIKLQSIKDDGSTKINIFYTKSRPRVNQYRWVETKPWQFGIASGNIKYEFYIPAGSVKQQFILDAN